MTTKPSKVTATAGATPDSVRVYYHDFPDLLADGDSIEDAAANSVQELERAGNDAHRDSLRRAVADVQAFIERAAAG